MLVVTLARTGAAEYAPIDHHLALEIDAFAAFGADYARPLKTGQVFRLHFYFYPLLVKKNIVGECGVGLLLAGILGHFGKHFTRHLLRGFFRRDAYSAACLQVNERRRHLAPIAEFQRALP